jgi:beta-glucosidase
LYPFGHGLSYTQFGYGDLTVRGGRTITASFTVRNIGALQGKDVPQLYLVDEAGRQVRRLIGFEKVSLKPGEARRVTLNVDRRLLTNFDVPTNSWRIARGRYGVALARSAQDFVLKGEAQISSQSIAP